MDMNTTIEQLEKDGAFARALIRFEGALATSPKQQTEFAAIRHEVERLMATVAWLELENWELKAEVDAPRGGRAMIVRHIETGKRKDAIDRVAQLFEDWEANKPGVDKWTVLCVAFGLMNQGLIQLWRIQDIAMEIGMQPGVVASRRREWLKMVAD
jgi:hypothetical protein